MSYDVRLLTVDDLPAAWELSRRAFGSSGEAPPGWLTARPGRHQWGLFDTSGRLVARATDREQEQWFGGRKVSTAGVAGVAVAPELRRAGLAREVMTALLNGAHERGAVISTLFRTTLGLYRRLGYEEVGVLEWTSVATAMLAGLKAPEGVSLRSAELADVPAILEIYRAVAEQGSGLMERAAPLFDTSSEAVLNGHDGITVAEAEGRIEGYASWDRGPGYDRDSWLSVPDLCALNARATTALLAMLGTWATVAPTLHLRLPASDPSVYLGPMVDRRVKSRDPWMLRVVDAVGAVAARGWPVAVDGCVDLLLEDELCPWNAGPYRLVVEGGQGRLERGGSGALRVTPRGFAVLYAGAADPAVLRRAGLLDGDVGSDSFLRVATAGPQPALLDYF